MKKRILALLLMLGVMFNTASVFAASNLNIASTEGSYTFEYDENDTFTIDFEIDNNDSVGLNNATFFVTYDPNVIQAVPNTGYADNTIQYTNNDGEQRYLMNNSMINGQLNIAPEGVAGFSGTSAEAGKVKLAALITAFDSNNNLISTYENGVLFRMTFKMVGTGSTDVSLSNCVFGKFADGKGEKVYASISPANVSITGSGSNNNNNNNNNTTATTVATTEATTQATTTSSSNGGGNSNNNRTTTTRATTTEATTVGTTKAVETTTEATTQAVVASFNDIEDYPWAVEAINNLASKGIVNGYSDGSFKPTAQVKRADFILMLLKAMEVDVTKAPSSNFSDVQSDKYYANAVGIAKDMGIANGNGDGTFSPESSITRQDMMILAKKALEIKTSNTITGNTAVLDKFSDKLDISAYAVESLAAMVSEELVNGTGNKIEPKANTTRAQAAVIINKLYEKMK